MLRLTVLIYRTSFLVFDKPDGNNQYGLQCYKSTRSQKGLQNLPRN